MVQNRDVVKELNVGMLVATADPRANFPRVGTVHLITPDPSNDSHVTILWMEQEKAPHKPKWLRFFRPSSKNTVGMITFNDILLHDFDLTNNGALKKRSREYLKECFKWSTLFGFPFFVCKSVIVSRVLCQTFPLMGQSQHCYHWNSICTM